MKPSSPTGPRVLFVVSGYPSDDEPSRGTFHETSARALRGAGVDVRVVAPVPFVPRLPERLLPRRCRLMSRVPAISVREGVEVRSPRYLALPRQNHVGAPHLAMRRGLAHAFGDVGGCDLVHGHFAYPHGAAAIDVAKRFGVPAVLTLHGSDTNVFPDVNRLARRRFVRAVTAADRVTAVSDALAERAMRIAGRRPVVVPIGVDVERFESGARTRERAAALRSEWRRARPDAWRFVLFVGRYLETKGVGDLLQALDLLPGPDVVAVFAGQGPLTRAIGMHGRTLDLGVVRNEEMPSVMAAADAIVLPSHGEGLPTVLVEAGAVGLPIIATRVGGIPELLAPDRGRLVSPGDPAGLASAIERAVGDELALSRRMAERMRGHVAEHFDARAAARRLVAEYEAALGER